MIASPKRITAMGPGDVRDPESFKVRRGKVGGYREYLSIEDQKYAADALMKLDPRFGYNS
jgi:hypothetical protein